MGSDAGADSFLNDSWTWYAHDPADDKWTLDSYDALCTIATAKEFVQAHRAFSGLLTRGMHFLMRSHVKPIWECKENENGGCLSIKIMKNDVVNAWFDLGALLLGETLIKGTGTGAGAGGGGGTGFNPEMVTGISMSPKRSYCIFRIWVSTPALRNIDDFTFPIPNYSGVVFKLHKEHDTDA